VKLKKAEASEEPAPIKKSPPKSNPQDDLMKGILQGAGRLKKASNSPTVEENDNKGQGMFGM
jgi:hypothetical protein